MGASIDFINTLNLEEIYKHEKNLHDYAIEKLNSFNDISIYGMSKNKGSIIAFNFNDIHANDLAIILDQKEVALRTGHHCAQPLMKYLNINSCVRASFGVYNTIKDIDIFIDSLIESKNFLS